MNNVGYFNINNNSLIYYSRIGRLDIVNKLVSTPKIKIDAQNRDNNTNNYKHKSGDNSRKLTKSNKN